MTTSGVLDFRTVLEQKLLIKKNELVKTEQNLKKYANLVDRPYYGQSGRLSSFRGRLGPAVNHRDSVGGRTEHRNLGTRLGPVLDEDEEDSVETGGHVPVGEHGGMPSVMSRVFVEQKSRDDALAEQKVDKREVMRNRRMFGSILGTLQQFRADENKVKDREQKKREIEKKIDEKTEKEREEAIKEKRSLNDTKRKNEREIKVLQLQMKRIEEYEAWEANKRKEGNAIRTKSGHCKVYFLPQKHNESTMTALEDTMDLVDGEIKAARQVFEEELLKISKRAENCADEDLDELECDDDETEDADSADNELKTRSVVVSTVVKQPSTVENEHSESAHPRRDRREVRMREISDAKRYVHEIRHDSPEKNGTQEVSSIGQDLRDHMRNRREDHKTHREEANNHDHHHHKEESRMKVEPWKFEIQRKSKSRSPERRHDLDCIVSPDSGDRRNKRRRHSLHESPEVDNECSKSWKASPPPTVLHPDNTNVSKKKRVEDSPSRLRKYNEAFGSKSKNVPLKSRRSSSIGSSSSSDDEDDGSSTSDEGSSSSYDSESSSESSSSDSGSSSSSEEENRRNKKKGSIGAPPRSSNNKKSTSARK